MSAIKVKLITPALNKFAAIFFKLSPSLLSIFFGRYGFTRFLKKVSGVQFIASLYNTDLLFYLHADRYLEREAGSRKTANNDPVKGLSLFFLENATAIDVGANVGTMSLYIASRGAAKIYSFEPGPLQSDLRRNISLNKLEDRIIPVPMGLSDTEESMFWAEDQNNPGNAHLLKEFDELNMSKIQTNFGDSSLLKKVDVTTLDKYFSGNQSLSRLDLIKIDVEGLELRVLNGGKNIIQNYRPYLVIETHRVASDMMRYDCITPIFDFLYSLEYKSYYLNDDGFLEEFIYPNFRMDTFFVPKSRQIIGYSHDHA